MTEGPKHFDAVVVGSGVGGSCAAALLAHAGHRTLLVEREDRLGGRASTREIDGFQVGTGAIALEFGGPLEQVFHTVGARYELRTPRVGVVVRTRHRMIETTRGPVRVLVDGVVRRFGARMLQRTKDSDRTLGEWARRYARIPVAQRALRNLVAALWGVNSDDIPASAAFTFLTTKGAFRRYGMCPHGTKHLIENLADVVTARGGEVWLSSTVTRLHVRHGRVTGATIRRDGADETVSCDVAVSNAGPRATGQLCDPGVLPAEYVSLVAERAVATPVVVVDFASRTPLLGEGGIVFFADTSRVSAMTQLMPTCPELAPPGWYLYSAYGVPIPALTPFDEAAEIEATLDELRREMPRFQKEARILQTVLLRDDWPCTRAVAGRELPRHTPLPNLWNVGDGVRDFGDGGTAACAQTALDVAARIGPPRATGKDGAEARSDDREPERCP